MQLAHAAFACNLGGQLGWLLDFGQKQQGGGSSMAVGRIRLHPQNDLCLSRLVWGAWRALDSAATRTPQDMAAVIKKCLALGITSFDHADIYGGYQVEALFGEAWRLVGLPRRDIELITKCDIMLQGPARPLHRVKHYDTGAAHILASVEASLQYFQTDYLDLLLLHRPDPLMQADETAKALEELVKTGKVRAIGVSNHLPATIDLLQSRLSFPLVTNQIEVSLLCLEAFFNGTLDHAQKLQMAPMVWSPLGGGGLFHPDKGEREARIHAALRQVSAEHDTPDTGTVALAWLLRHPSRLVPVLGTAAPQRLEQYARAEELAMTRQQWFQLYQAALGYEVP
jgi:predicted oxidoreductase